MKISPNLYGRTDGSKFGFFPGSNKFLAMCNITLYSVFIFKSKMSLFGSFKAMLGAGIGSAFLPDGNPLGLHLVMFQPTIAGQGTLEQQVKWLGKAWNLEIIGKYQIDSVLKLTLSWDICTTKLYLRRLINSRC